MLVSDYVEYWASRDLTVWDESALEMLSMPASSKNFLQEIGMPAPLRNIGLWKFDWVKKPLCFDSKGDFRLIACNYNSPRFYINEREDGAVYSISATAIDAYSTPVNSSIEKFAFCLTALDKRSYLSYDDPDYAKIVSEFEQELKNIDPEMMENMDSLWSNKIFDWRLEGGIEPR
jgi:hypothetical protein